VCARKARTHGRIEGIVLLKPLFGRGVLEPKAQNVRGPGAARHGNFSFTSRPPNGAVGEA
jgi:hypothetical protein